MKNPDYKAFFEDYNSADNIEDVLTDLQLDVEHLTVDEDDEDWEEEWAEDDDYFEWMNFNKP